MRGAGALRPSVHVLYAVSMYALRCAVGGFFSAQKTGYYAPCLARRWYTCGRARMEFPQFWRVKNDMMRCVRVHGLHYSETFPQIFRMYI